MPFPINLPTTSSLSLPTHFQSPTHRSLPHAATTHRSVLRAQLKTYKRLPPSQQASHLPSLLSALNAYLPYLLALSTGLNPRNSSIDVILQQEPTPEWRATLTSRTLSDRSLSNKRTKTTGIDAEIGFVLSTLGYIHTLLAREALRGLTRAGVKPEDKTAATTKAMKELLDAHSVHTCLANRVQGHSSEGGELPLDIGFPVQSALAALALAEATLLPVMKEDPYPSALAEERSKTSTEWMVGTVKMASVRAGLFARLCVMAGEHAGRAVGLLGQEGSKLDEGLVRYAGDLRKAARAKACRFLGVDAEGRGETGEAIAWIRGARREVGGGKGAKEDTGKGLGKLRKDFKEKKEDRKIDQGGDEWGLDAGRAEEERVLEWLEKKWSKMNDTVSFETRALRSLGTVPPYEPLLAGMPSGREYHSPKPFEPPLLDEGTLASMRAPPDSTGDPVEGDQDDSDDDTVFYLSPAGAFPGTEKQYPPSSQAKYW
ncbi:MAG: hypothetical protein M1820_002434 [Bogoriella megaspora]|nr:MAG: hypothetical protein M1820_002434 [Bogoriella megaspora]